MDYRRIKAIEEANKRRILKVNPDVNNDPGIYFLTRNDEEGFKFAYIGQAKCLLRRLAQHLAGYDQHIDRSLKKHGLHSQEKPFGWRVNFLNFPFELLDEKEKEYIKKYADDGFQLLNGTSGGQGDGKKNLGIGKSTKGYRDGIEQGKKNASKEVAGYFDKYLDVIIKKTCFTKKNEPSKNAENALQRFRDFLEYHKNSKEDDE